MLRYRKYLIVGGFLTVLIAYLLPGYITTLDGMLSLPARVGNVSLEEAQTSIAYRLDHGAWLEFPIPTASEQIKVISNASIPVEVTTPDAEWRYALRYQVVGQHGKVLDERVYHHRTHITRYIGEGGQTGRYHSYFIDASNIVADGRQMLIDISQLGKTDLFRISLERRQPGISELVVRAYAPEKVAEHKLAASWQRMSTHKKENLAKGNVYPIKLISDAEKRNLLRKQWRPMGPNGLDGIQYFPRMLYSFSGQEKENLKEEILPVGLEIDVDHHGVVTIPEHGGELRLEFRRVDTGESAGFDGVVHLSWFGRTAKQYWQKTIDWSGENPFSTGRNIDGGYLLIRSVDSIVLRAYLHTSAGETEITPELIVNRLYMAQPDIPVEYAIHHNGLQNTPIRIDVRRLFDGAEHSEVVSADVDFELLDEKMRVVKTGSLALPDRVSFFDRFRGDFASNRVSDPASFYLLVPSEVSYLRLKHSKSALVNMYNRPNTLHKKIHVPEDAFPGTVEPQVLPSWFLLRPSNLRKLTVNRRSVLLYGQSRPPVDRIQKSREEYVWQEIKPDTNRGSDFLLTPHNADDIRRDQALGSIFCEIPTQKSVNLNLKAHGELRSIKPQLAYIQEWDRPFALKVLLDGRFLYRVDKIARQGIAILPSIASGQHRLRLNTNKSVRFYMNHLSSCPRATYLKRKVYRFDSKGLEFVYRKSSWDKENLSARLYTHYESVGRTAVDVRIHNVKRSAVTLYRGWTFKSLRYDIRPADGKPAFILQNTPTLLNAGQSFFIPFEKDLPPGDYRVTFSPRENVNGYLSLLSRSFGKNQQHWIYKDTPAFANQH